MAFDTGKHNCVPYYEGLWFSNYCGSAFNNVDMLRFLKLEGLSVALVWIHCATMTTQLPAFPERLPKDSSGESINIFQGWQSFS